MCFQERKSPRLKKYDYNTPGYYFVTVCTHEKKKILCEIVDNKSNSIVGEGLSALPKVNLTPIGEIVKNSIEWINSNYADISVDKYVVMPNHIHLILIKHQTKIISENSSVGGHGDPPLRNTGIDDVIGRLKSYTTHLYKKTMWQRSFHDHIIRNEGDYLKIWEYIHTNPAQWKNDCFYLEY